MREALEKIAALLIRAAIFFFFQAEDGIRDYKVTGVQTCALPISCHTLAGVSGVLSCLMPSSLSASITPFVMQGGPPIAPDSPQPLAPSGLVRQEVGRASGRGRG